MQRGKIFISVKDSGTGIPETEIPKIFSDFCTLKFNAHLNPNGVGLGLSICKKICNNLQGDISVESKIGFGTTFTFNISADLFPVREKHGEATSSGVQSGTGRGLEESISEISAVVNKMQLVFKQFNTGEESKRNIEMASTIGPTSHNSKGNISNSRILVVDDQIFNIEFLRC